ncbi:NAD-dependent succinate-semialdehyde dehydrogenase [Fulvivirgaceae bacterium BMA12]|uniref:NAD-dependent succinate-semialdehyde dehydrogenase n=1 Tax=Agaribacillus aureus TaxID=3051825 RepID=A0ABT8L6U9_9BACT|nr:NAD-dependent succinate-semialdehyde dehydrogenase [Fulvivirgaceae bacterium BMA12]
MIKTINPTTEEVITQYRFLDQVEVEKFINQTQQAQRVWKETGMADRAAGMRKAADTLIKHKSTYARLMAEEMGKPLPDGESEIEKCARVCHYYADHAADFLANEPVPSHSGKSVVTFQPLGIVFAIMPWNFPFWQVFRFAAPSLMAGNGAMLKHAPNVFGCAGAIESIFREAGFPEGLFQNLIIDTDMAAKVIAHPAISAVTFTGSTRAGRLVAEKAGQNLKKTVLELGGSDPYLILEDANLEIAIKACVTSRMINNGQSCISAKRFIVSHVIQSEFENRLVAGMAGIQPGNPLSPETKAGPMARADLRTALHEQVQKSIDLGAKCLTGGQIPAGKGYFYPPTVLTNIKRGMPAYQEELFGPVAAIITAHSEEEAIAIANDTSFGLGAAIFTEDLDKAEKMASVDIEAGSCYINSFVQSDPVLPFGGIKESGYGRELSHYGIREFVNIKTVYIK